MGSVPIDSASEALGRVGDWRADGAAPVREPDTCQEGAAVPSWRCAVARGWAELRLRVETNEQATVAATVLALVVVSAVIVVAPFAVPWVAYIPFVVLSGAMHSPRRHAAVLGLTVAAILLTSVLTAPTKPDGVGAALATLGVGVVTLWRSICRAKVGVQGGRGETMLADLRTRLVKRGSVPALPPEWCAETCVQSAYGQRFSGDFVVTRRTEGGRLLEVALVDVSGKGMEAGSRSLVLSGAFDALLGSVPPADFMVAANDYVVRQEWTEGFASAVYLCLDLDTGEYAVSGAGHPPAVRHDAANNRWVPIESGSGPVLGLVEGLRFPCYRGALAPGEALMLYTDGLIEDRRRDIDEGIGRLVAALDRHATRRFEGVARAACTNAAAGPCDDRGAVVVWRE